VSVFREIIDRLRERHPDVAGIGVGAAGMVDWPTGRIRWAPNNSYRELPLRELLEQETGLPTVVENDANAAAIAEATFGRGRGYTNLVTLTVGTGIGGGIVLNGRLFRGTTGLGAEVGHIIVDPTDGAMCGCGAVGCLEAMASGIALARTGREAAAADPTGMLATLAGGPDNVRGETVFEAVQRGDPTACQLFDRLGSWLGVGIASLVNILEPQIVIVAGGIAGSVGEVLLTPTRAAFTRFAFASTRRALPPIVPADLGADAGLIGATILALSDRASSTSAA